MSDDAPQEIHQADEVPQELRRLCYVPPLVGVAFPAPAVAGEA